MKYSLILLALGMSPVVQAADISSSTVQDRIADWSLVQSKGGIQLGLSLQHTIHSWQLPLTCDLTANSSGIVIQKTNVEQQGKDILISFLISQTVWTLTPQRGQCKPLIIESTPGVHQVFYRDGDGKKFPIGFTEFNLDSTVLNNPPG